MSSVKRKQAPSDSQPRAKKPASSTPSSSTPSSSTSSAKSATLLSALKEDAPLFPRGGADVLTPLEKRKIQNQATKDVLSSSSKKSAPANVLDDDVFGAYSETTAKPKHADVNADDDLDEDAMMLDVGGKKKAKREAKDGAHRRERKTKRSGKLDLDAARREGAAAVRAESLNVRKLDNGTLVLAQITDVKPFGVKLSLPNNLMADVDATFVSDALTQRLHQELDRAAKDNDSDDEESDHDHDSDSATAEEDLPSVDFSSLFHTGQYVRAAIIPHTSAAPTEPNGDSDAAATNSSFHLIKASLRPADANAGLDESDLVPHITLMAAVVSAEEHGYVLDIGLTDSPSIRGFLAKSEVDPALTGNDDGTSNPKSDVSLQPGAVFLCSVVSRSGNVCRVTTLPEKLSAVDQVPTETRSIHAFLPGTPVEVLVNEVEENAVIGTIVGSLDATADAVHSGRGPELAKLQEKFNIGSRYNARVLCTFPASQMEDRNPKVGVSYLAHVKSLKPKILRKSHATPLDRYPLSSFVEECTVRHVLANRGAYVDLSGIDAKDNVRGFVHVTRLSDELAAEENVDKRLKYNLLAEDSGDFKLDTVHRGRVVGYCAMDSLYHLSFQKRVLAQQYLRTADVPLGAVVSGSVSRILMKSDGVAGVFVTICDGVDGFVPLEQLSDVALQNPEKRYRPGTKVKARVLAVDPLRNRLTLTLKKTLVHADAPVLSRIEEATVGMRVPGTIRRFVSGGALLRFYGSLNAFLPLSLMSEAGIKDPKELFHIGQVVNVHILEVMQETGRLIVSCKDPGAFGLEKQKAFRELEIGQMVSAQVTEKTHDAVLVDLEGSGLRAFLYVGHLAERPSAKSTLAQFKKLKVGETLQDLMVLKKDDRQHTISLTRKPSLLQAFRDKCLLTKAEQATVGKIRNGFVCGITSTAVFVQFGGDVIGLLPRNRIPAGKQSLPSFGLERFQSVTVKVVNLPSPGRFVVSLVGEDDSANGKSAVASKLAETPIQIGDIVSVQITQKLDNQLNVSMVEKKDGSDEYAVTPIQGRIAVSQVFDSWEAITNPKKPLSAFRRGQILQARILGVHDAQTHRFLPISHRGAAHQVLELSAKPSDVQEQSEDATWSPLQVADLRLGQRYPAFVNRTGKGFVWVNLSATVRAQIPALYLTEDEAMLADIPRHFPVGCAVHARVETLDVEEGRVGLTLLDSPSALTLTWADLKPDMLLAGRVTKVADSQVLVSINSEIAGPVQLPDLSDDYEQASFLPYTRDDSVRVSVVEVDPRNKRVRFSLRPSRVETKTATAAATATPAYKKTAADREIRSVDDVSPGEVVRGFVKSTDFGVFIHLGGDVVAHAKINNLSDKYIKDWKQVFHIHQLVRCRILSVDHANKRLEASLKDSVVNNDKFQPQRPLGDYKEGEITSGVVRKVEEYGVFVALDNSQNVRGLCHRSEMAEKFIEDATKLYSEGDKVKVKIVKIDEEKRQLSLGMKPSYFDVDEEDGMEVDSDDDEENGEEEEEEEEEEGGVRLDSAIDMDVDSEDDEDVDSDEEDDNDDDDSDEGGDSRYEWTKSDPFADETDAKDKKRKGSAKTVAGTDAKSGLVDRTAQLDIDGPQTAAAFEKLLLERPDDSSLWIQYMALPIQVGDRDKARDVAERAIKTINMREEVQKLNVWMAYINLEMEFGTRESRDAVFQRACQHNDSLEVHERMVSILIQTNHYGEAEQLLESMAKKFGATHAHIWTNYSHFLHVTRGQPDRARALLPRALQAVQDERQHLGITTKFAALEFRSQNGDPERGRTFFAGLLETYPKKGDLWKQLLDLEISQLAAAAAAASSSSSSPGGGDPAPVRDVFERRIRLGARAGLKPAVAKKWFERWAAWEAQRGDTKSRDKVLVRAREWVQQYKLQRN